MPTKTVKEFSGYTTLHGLGRLGDSKYVIQKIFWSLAFLTSLGMCIFQVYRLGQQFMGFQVNTKMTMKHEPQKFPGISICNVNPVRYADVVHEPSLFQIIEKTAEIYKINLDEFDKEGNFQNPNHNYKTKYDPDSLPEIDPLGAARRLFIIRMENLTTKSVFHMAQKFEEFVLSCKLMGQYCGERNFTIYRDPNYGICYALDTDHLYADTPGISKGLSIIFNIQQEHYIPFVTEDAGIRVAVHDSNYNGDVESMGISLPPGFQVDIGLTTKITERLPGPNKLCDESNQYPNVLSCTEKCIKQRIVQTCLCAMTVDDLEENVPYCDILDIECIDKVVADKDTNRHCSCKIPCREVSYEKTISMTSWPADQYEPVVKKVIADGMDYSGLKEDLVMMKISFTSLITQTVTEEKAYTEENFVSDIGGQLGLWIGMSVLSMAEVLELIVLLITHCCRKRKTIDTIPLK